MGKDPAPNDAGSLSQWGELPRARPSARNLGQFRLCSFVVANKPEALT
jgi:hypothetical protein